MNTYWMRKMTAVILCALVIFAAGCAENEPAASKQAEQAEQAEQNAEAEASVVRNIEHSMGTTPVTGVPSRIVTLYQGANDVIVAFGVTPVGVVESWDDEPVYDYLKQELNGVQLVGEEGQPNLEVIHQLQPDLIIAAKVRHEEIYGQLSQIAPTLVATELFDWRETVNLIAQALDMGGKETELLTAWDNRVADFKAKMSDRLPIEATIVNFRSDHARIYYKGYAGLIIEELGFTRPAGHDQDLWGVQLTSKESIPDMNADLIFTFYDDIEAVHKMKQEWTSHPLWAGIDAVKNNQVFEVDSVAWNLAGGYLSAHLMLDDIYEMFGVEE